MRPSLIPGLVAARKNADRGFPDVALFEVGQIFKGDQPGGSVHRRDRRAPRAGNSNEIGRHGTREPGEADAFDVKGDVLALLNSLLKQRQRVGLGVEGVGSARALPVPADAGRPWRARGGRRQAAMN